MPKARAVGVPIDDGDHVSVDDHIPEDELAAFAFDPASVSPERSSEIQRHNARCASCRLAFDFFVVADDDLTDTDVWEPVTGSETLASLRAYAARIAEEDREARELLKDWLVAPTAKVAWSNIATQRRFLHGGVVRLLSAHAHNVCADDALDALTFADAAISVAEALPKDTYPANAVFELRGTAWKERANALLRLGEFGDAHESLNRAERNYNKLLSKALAMSSVALVRAATFYQQEQLSEAARLAERAEHGFAHLGDVEGCMKALHLRASIKYETFEFGLAIELFQRVREYGEAANDPSWVAKASYGIGNCELDRGNIGEASAHFHTARTVFMEIAPTSSDRVSTDWGIARVLLHCGKATEAIQQLRVVMAEFQDRGMITDAALAGLDVADGLLALDRMKEIVALASDLFRVFTETGMLTGALRAFAYMKEAASSGSITSEAVNAVRSFLRRVDRQPDLVFAPPPSS